MEEFELEPGEKITLSVRQHPIVLYGKLIPYAILALLPFLVPIALHYASSYDLSATTMVSTDLSNFSQWVHLLLGLYLLILWMSAFSIVTRFYLTSWVITTTRIVDIHQFGFFSRQVSSFLLNRVQDVTTDTEGILATIFGFGTLNVETAGREEKFQMRGISHSIEIRDLIMREIAALHADGQPAPSSTSV